MITINLVKYFLFGSLLLSISCSSIKGEQDVVEKAKAIHTKILTVDTHCDTPMRMVNSDWDIGERHESVHRRNSKIDLPRMKEGGLDAEFFAAFVGQRQRTDENYRWAQNRADELISAVITMCEKYSDRIALATTPSDAYRNEKEGRLSAFIGMENGFPIGKDIANIKRYYDMGVRYITLCHTRNNDICDSSNDRNGPEHHGLSDFGRQVVAEMNRLGMIIDVSHISDEAFYNVLAVSKTPVIASHSCVRTLCDNPRNLSDDMLKALAKNNGVIQICILSEYLKKSPSNPERESALQALRDKYGPWEDVKDPKIREKYRNEYYAVDEKYPPKKATVQDVVDHIDHVVNLVGVDHVGIGTDFDGGGGISDCDNVAEMPNITIELVKRGYSEKDISKIWGGNFMRVFGQVIKLSSLSLSNNTAE